MSRPLLTLEEVIAVLEFIEVPRKVIDEFQQRADYLIQKKGISRHEVDNVAVASGFGHQSQRGHVELVVNDQVTQMEVRKAQEIGLMLLQAAEAAQSDEILVKLLERVGLPPEARAGMLMELREIRQGTRDVVRPH